MVNSVGNFTCVHCGAPLPPIARFCMTCGGAQAATDSRMRAAHVLGERKLITVLFADVVDSTTLAECMDPEDWASVMNHAFERLSPIIPDYGGTIARLMGDGLLAFFGAPTVHEDDPLRAVEAARELLATAQDFSREVEPRLRRPFELRIGINTGWVVLGDVGTDLKFEYTAMGDAVNVAARMQAAAEPMTALLTGDTYHHVSDRVACRDRGVVAIRGRSGPVHAFELELASPSPLPCEVTVGVPPNARDQETAGEFVGREIELAQLRTCLDALANGQGGLLQVTGVAGIGKTRLVAEARRLHDPVAVQWVQGRAARPFLGQAGAFAPFEWIVQGLAAADRLAEPDIALEICRQFERLLDRRPVVLVLDDVQWLDPASMQVLRALARLAARRPLLVCVVGRLGAALPARFAAAEQLVLSGLDMVDSARLVRSVLASGSEADWPGLADAAYALADGNPLFTASIVRTAVLECAGDRPLVACLPVPACVQQVVSARLDQLEAEVKEILRLMSVVGRNVAYRVLCEIADCPDRLAESLNTLERADLLQRVNVDGELTYRFTSALDWRILSGGVLNRRRLEIQARLRLPVREEARLAIAG